MNLIGLITGPLGRALAWLLGLLVLLGVNARGNHHKAKATAARDKLDAVKKDNQTRKDVTDAISNSKRGGSGWGDRLRNHNAQHGRNL